MADAEAAPAAARVLSVAGAQERAAALLAATSQPALSPADSERLAQTVAELGKFAVRIKNREAADELLQTPGLLRAAFAAARRAPGNEAAWIGACILIKMPNSATAHIPLCVSEVMDAEAPAFALECAQLFRASHNAVCRALGALCLLNEHVPADMWPGLTEACLSALESHPGVAEVVGNAAQLLRIALSTDDAIAQLIVARGQAVTAALERAADWGSSSATQTIAGLCVSLLSDVFGADHAVSSGYHELVTPAVVHAMLRVLRCDLANDSRAQACASIFTRARSFDLAEFSGIAEALVMELKLHPESKALRRSVSVVLAVFSDRGKLSEMMGSEARAAGGLLPIVHALRACVADSADENGDFASHILAAAYLILMAPPPGGDDSDIDAALRAGVGVAAFALARRYASHQDCVSNAFVVVTLFATSPARCEALFAAGAFRVAASALRNLPDSPFVQQHALNAVAVVLVACPQHAAAAGEAGIVELAARALQAYNTYSGVAGAASTALGNLCKAVPANAVRAMVKGAPAAAVAALQIHGTRRADISSRIMRGLYSMSIELRGPWAHAAAAGAVSAIVAAMHAHPDDADVQGSSGSCLLAVLKGTSPDVRLSVLDAVAHTLVPAFKAGLRRHRGSVPAMGGLMDGMLALMCDGGPYMQQMFDEMADLLQQPDIVDDLVHAAYSGILITVAKHHDAGARLTPAQLATALAVVQQRGVYDTNLAAKPLAVIARHMRADARLAVSPLAADAMAAAAAAAAVTREAADLCHLRVAAATLLDAALAHGGTVADAAAKMGRRAGLLPLLETGGPLVRESWEPDLEPSRPALLARLRAAPADTDSGACGCGGTDAACERCAQLRARGKRCGLPGCGGTRRADEPERAMARCARCRRAAYCCSTHQKDDWARHKAECAAFAAQQQAAAVGEQEQ